MALINLLMDVRLWIATGIILAFMIGSFGPSTPTLVIIVLMVQMILSMDGMNLNRKDLASNKSAIMWSIIACFGIGSVSALAVGSLFIGSHPDIWKGWVMLASVPCAISVITAALYMKGNMVMSLMSVTSIYLSALVITPVLTYVFIGDAVSPFEIFQYVLLFIAVPLLATIPMKKVHLKRTHKVIMINLMMLLMIMMAVGYNRDYIIDQPMIVMYIAAASFIRIFLISLVMIAIMKRHKADRDKAVVYMTLAVWKNSGLAITLCLVLLEDAAEAVIPCVISAMVETIWFALMVGYVNRSWPQEQPANRHVNG